MNRELIAELLAPGVKGDNAIDAVLAMAGSGKDRSVVRCALEGASSFD